MYHWTGNMLEERQHAYKSMREVQGGTLRCTSRQHRISGPDVYFGILILGRIIPGTSHKVRSFWAGPYRVMKLNALALPEIKLLYYPGEERLVSLDLLILYSGEDVIHQNPEDIDLDQWLDEGELTELPEVHRTEAEERLGNEAEAPAGTSEADNGPYLEIPIILEEPETIVMKG